MGPAHQESPYLVSETTDKTLNRALRGDRASGTAAHAQGMGRGPRRAFICSKRFRRDWFSSST